MEKENGNGKLEGGRKFSGCMLFFFALVLMFNKFSFTTTTRMLFPFAPFLEEEYSVSKSEFSVVLAIGEFSTLIAAPFVGPFVDRFGSFWVNLSCTCVMFLATAAVALDNSFLLLCVLRGVFNLARAGSLVATSSFCGEVVDNANIGRVTGFVELSWGLSTILGIPLALVMLDHLSWSVVTIVISSWLLPCIFGLCWIGVVLKKKIQSDSSSAPSTIGETEQFLESPPALQLQSESKPQRKMPVATSSAKKALAHIFTDSDTMALLLWCPCLTTGASLLFTNYATWLVDKFDLSASELGAATIVIGASEIGSEVVCSLFADRVGLVKTMYFCSLVAGGFYFLLPHIDSTLASSLAGMFCCYFFFELAYVASLSYSSKIVSKEQTGTFLGLFFGFMGLGFVIGGASGASIYEYGGIEATGYVCGASTLVSVLFLSLRLRNHGLQPSEAVRYRSNVAAQASTTPVNESPVETEVPDHTNQQPAGNTEMVTV